MIDWLLQAGFRLRGTTGSIAVDPYLSDRCREVYGLSRRREAPLTADQLEVDVVCVSHWHEDHLDLPTVLTLVANGVHLVAPASCLARVQGLAAGGRPLDADLLHAATAGDTVGLGGAVISVVPARHAVPGYLTEDAVGYVIELDGVRVYHCGDTEYDRALLAAAGQPLDVALLCVNGTGGNMNSVEAAALAAQLRPRIAVPMHVGLWTDEGYGPGAELDPQRFADLCAALAPEVQVVLPDTDHPLAVSPR